MKVHLIVEAKDSMEGMFKDVTESYIDNKGFITYNENGIYSISLDELKRMNTERIRGIPVDASKVYLNYVKQTKGYDYSYYYLREIEMYDNTLINNLKTLQAERKICHNCIRICFFFEGE
jgi:hypothetical protein